MLCVKAIRTRAKHVTRNEVTHVNILAVLRANIHVSHYSGQNIASERVLTSNICPSAVASGQHQTTGALGGRCGLTERRWHRMARVLAHRHIDGKAARHEGAENKVADEPEPHRASK